MLFHFQATQCFLLLGHAVHLLDDRARVDLCLALVRLREGLLVWNSLLGSATLALRRCCLYRELIGVFKRLVNLEFASRHSQLCLLKRLALFRRRKSHSASYNTLLLHTNVIVNGALRAALFVLLDAL